MNSVQTDFVSQPAQAPVANASPEASGIHLGRTVVSSQPGGCTCLSNPPPSYEEAMQCREAIQHEQATQPTQINIPVARYVLNESQKLLRSTEQSERERRAGAEECCLALCSDGCCGDFTLICCYITCCLCLFFCD